MRRIIEKIYDEIDGKYEVVEYDDELKHRFLHYEGNEFEIDEDNNCVGMDLAKYDDDGNPIEESDNFEIEIEDEIEEC